MPRRKRDKTISTNGHDKRGGHGHDHPDHVVLEAPDHHPSELTTLIELDAMERLNPYLFMDKLLNDDNEPVYRLYIRFKKDSADQKIEVVENRPPVYPEVSRILTIDAHHVVSEAGDFDYHGSVDIPVAERLKHETTIFVQIDHDHQPHGGSGSIHYPPGGDGD